MALTTLASDLIHLLESSWFNSQQRSVQLDHRHGIAIDFTFANSGNWRTVMARGSLTRQVFGLNCQHRTAASATLQVNDQFEN